MKLLKRLLPSQDNDALIGDITEEAPRRSRTWYWAQIAALLVIGPWRTARTHPAIAVRAVGVGLATLVLYDRTVTVVTRWMMLHARLVSLQYATVVILAITGSGFFVSGWTTARLHRKYGMEMVMPYVTLVSMLMALLWVALLAITLRDNGAAARARPLVQLIWMVGPAFVSIPCAIFLGGICGLKRDPAGSAQPFSGPRPSQPRGTQ